MKDLIIPLVGIMALGLLAIFINLFTSIDKLNKQLSVSNTNSKPSAFLAAAKYFIYIPFLLFFIAYIINWQLKKSENQRKIILEKSKIRAAFDTATIYIAPDPLSIKHENDVDLILYGRDLIVHTSDYLGPEGSVKPISNGMNCQNCHLDAGSKPYGNNYIAVAANYPKFRARSGTAETIYKRVNDCIQRSLNGQALDSTSREMKAIEAYIKWLGDGVPKGKMPKGAGLLKIKPLIRAANPDSGRLVFMQKCQSCHGENGQGLPMPEGNGRKYPPLWGEKSYNEAAGLFRLSMFAGYVKSNMPFGASYENPQLTDAESWDLAAFVNSQPRPKHPFLTVDWPKIAGKPYDHPFGPFADSFPESQHKFGPFQPIIDWQKQNQAKK
jgi:thiosulfate dehydrogenase